MRLPNESGYLYEFGWLRRPQNLLKGKNFLVAVACNHPNYLGLPFRIPMVHGLRLRYTI